jgi:hypothetical protein
VPDGPWTESWHAWAPGLLSCESLLEFLGRAIAYISEHEDASLMQLLDVAVGIGLAEARVDQQLAQLFVPGDVLALNTTWIRRHGLAIDIPEAALSLLRRAAGKSALALAAFDLTREVADNVVRPGTPGELPLRLEPRIALWLAHENSDSVAGNAGRQQRVDHATGLGLIGVAPANDGHTSLLER